MILLNIVLESLCATITDRGTYLFKCPWSDNQPVNDIHGDADDRRSPYAVTQDDTPVGIIILEES